MKTLADIAASLQGYDPQALSADDVLVFLSRLVTPVPGLVELPLFEALGRVLAADVVSPFDVPPHDNSAMDGYAFAGRDLAATPPPDGAELAWSGPARRSLAPGEALELKIVGTALAGKAWQGTVQAGECVKIMTGAVMPQGLDTVVPQEFVTVRDASITLPAQLLKAGDNRRLRGEDLQKGRPALLKGELLTPARLGLAASLGLETLPCRRPLRVAYFSTGDEILSLGEAPREGAVYDSNRYTVFGLLKRMGCEMIDMGVVRDDPAFLEAAFTRAALQADAVITSGGVSVGEADYTRIMMKKLGDVAFWRIAMRPGRPMAVGRLLPANLQEKSASGPRSMSATSYKKNSTQIEGEAAPSGGREAHEATSVGAILFGLPGNPVAVMVTFLAFVRPTLLRMMGASAAAPPMLKARSLEAIRKKPGRTEYQRGWVSTAADGSLQVKTTGNQGSGVLSSMAEANGLIVLHHDQHSVAPGEEVDVMMFDGVI